MNFLLHLLVSLFWLGWLSAMALMAYYILRG